LKELGDLVIPDPIEKGIPDHVWDMVCKAPPLEDANRPSHEVVELAEQRQQARLKKDWAESDRLRDQISTHGWVVQDGKDGYKLVKN
jgi:cysteinyl-tRNA synthetase